MEDSQIIRLYFDRAEEAIAQTAVKYGGYLHSVACNILRDPEDSRECVNDTYWRAWNSIPPCRPVSLPAFLGRITRNLALDAYRRRTAGSRGGGEMTLALEELGECVPAAMGPEEQLEKMVLTDLINGFLDNLSPENRRIFLRRYWYLSSVREIAQDYGLTQSKVKMSLLRSRNRLRQALEKEGIPL